MWLTVFILSVELIRTVPSFLFGGVNVGCHKEYLVDATYVFMDQVSELRCMIPIEKHCHQVTAFGTCVWRHFFIFSSYFRVGTFLWFYIGGHTTRQVPVPSGWFHLVINIIKPHDEQGLQIYSDGVQVNGKYSYFLPNQTQDGSERVVIGKLFDDSKSILCNDSIKIPSSVQVDELMFFNKALNQAEITELGQWSQ